MAVSLFASRVVREMNRPSNSRALRLRTILPTNHIAIVWDGAGRVKTQTSCDSNKMWTSRDEPGRYLNRLPIRARLLARLSRNARAPASAGAPFKAETPHFTWFLIQ